MSYQQVIILGNAGKDAEVRHLDGGKVAATITIATSENFTDRNGNKTERTEWHTISAWGLPSWWWASSAPAASRAAA